MKWRLKFADRWLLKKLRVKQSRLSLNRSCVWMPQHLKQFLGDVIGDLNRRRGKISGQETHKASVKLLQRSHLSEMFGYSTSYVP